MDTMISATISLQTQGPERIQKATKRAIHEFVRNGKGA
jgi:hypothetical protein